VIESPSKSPAKNEKIDNDIESEPEIDEYASDAFDTTPRIPTKKQTEPIIEPKKSLTKHSSK
jgi:hypothetical protein